MVMSRRSLSNVIVTVDIITPSDGNKADTLAAFIHFVDVRRSPSDSDSILFAKTTSRQKDALSALKSSLSQTLPAYMVPSVIIPVAYMPLNSAGKTDRNLLRSFAAQLSTKALASFSMSAAAQKVPPTSDMELRLSKAWSEVLNIDYDDIGANDHFFRIGGNSISAM